MSKNEKYLLVVVVILIVIAVWMSQCNKKQEYYEILPNSKTNIGNLSLNKRFNILIDGVNQTSLEQLKQNYNQVWNNEFMITDLINLWYYTNTINNKIVEGRLYYKFGGSSVGFWNASFTYDTTTGLYSVLMNTSNGASETYNGLSNLELNKLTMYYPYVTNYATTTTVSKRTIQNNDAKLFCFKLNDIDIVKENIKKDVQMLSDKYTNYFIDKYKNHFVTLDAHSFN